MKKYILFVVILFVLACKKNNADTKTSQYTNSTKKTNLNVNLNPLKSISKDNTFKNRDSLFELSMKFYNERNWEEFDVISKIHLKNSLLARDSINLGKAFRYRAGYFKNTNVLDSAFYNYIKAEKIYLALKDDLNYGNILYNKGIVQYYINNFSGAQLSLSKAYYKLKNSNDYVKLYGVINQLGLVHNDLKDYDLSIKYFKQAIKIVEEHNLNNEEHQKSICLSNIGFVYQNQENFLKAIEYYNLSLLDKKIKTDNPILYSNIIDNYSYCKLKINDYDNVLSLLHESLAIRKSFEFPSPIIQSYINISEYYHLNKELDSSKKYAKNSFELAVSSKNPLDYLSSLKQLSKIDNSYIQLYSKDYARITDSIQLEERKSIDRFARIQLETDEILQEKGALEDKNRNLLYFLFSSVGAFGILYYLRVQRAKNRELLYRQAQQQANEEIFNLMMSQQAIIDESRSEEKKKIAQELHDGILGKMFGLRMNLDGINMLTREDASHKKEEIISELKKIEQDIREISHDLSREKQALINNFVSIVQNLIEDQENLHKTKVTFFMDDTIIWDKVKNNIKINFYRILQECLQNINKYSGATEVNVGFVNDGDNIILKVQDNGKGFDVTKKSKGIGTQNMNSRVEECGGTLEIDSSVGQGTTVVATIPFIKN